MNQLPQDRSDWINEWNLHLNFGLLHIPVVYHQKCDIITFADSLCCKTVWINQSPHDMSVWINKSNSHLNFGLPHFPVVYHQECDISTSVAVNFQSVRSSRTNAFSTVWVFLQSSKLISWPKAYFFAEPPMLIWKHRNFIVCGIILEISVLNGYLSGTGPKRYQRCPALKIRQPSGSV